MMNIFVHVAFPLFWNIPILEYNLRIYQMKGY